jgi:ribosomal protein S27AE
MSNIWLPPARAARLVKCARGTLFAAVLRGELRAACGKCHITLSKSSITRGHLCRRLPRRVKTIPMVFKRQHLEKFTISPVHRAAGRASARKRAENPKNGRKSAKTLKKRARHA